MDLTPEQQNSLRSGQTIYVKGMTDGKGELFNAYVKTNVEESKLNFYRWNPDNAKSTAKEVTPVNEGRTQVAVNGGKTDESLKNVKEPVKQGQNAPTKEQEQKTVRPLKKSGGVKM